MDYWGPKGILVPQVTEINGVAGGFPLFLRLCKLVDILCN